MIGIDLVDIARVEKIMRHEHFLESVFDQTERDYIDQKNQSAHTVAGLWAAKEAVLKALGTGIESIRSLQEVQIRHDDKGAVYAVKNGRRFELSITHEQAYAAAVCYGESSLQEMRSYTSAPEHLKKRPRHSHKGDYGKVAIIGGSQGMCGSISLCAMAALRCGSGLVYNYCPACIAEIMQIKALENIIIPVRDCEGKISTDCLYDLNESLTDKDVLAVGCGMGRPTEGLIFMKSLFHIAKQPMVVDADGLNIVSTDPSILKIGGPKILTPHMAEMARLCGLSVEDLKKDPQNIARSFAKQYGAVLVLKGHHSFVTDGEKTYINRTGNPGMATAGSGDVLTGIISSLCGQGWEPYQAAVLGVYLHGLAGDIAAARLGEYSVMARDLIEALPQAISYNIKENSEGEE